MVEVKIYGRIFHLETEEARGWWAEYVLSSPKKMGRHLALAEHVIEQLAPALPSSPVVVEMFAGLGGNAVLVEERLSPRLHLLFDMHPAAVRHLRGAFPAARVEQADSYQVPLPASADLLILDMGDFTATKIEHPRYRGLLERAFTEAAPSAVTVTDTAGTFHHLHNHQYSRIVGRNPSYPDYLRGLAAALEDRYGYFHEATAYQRGTAVLGFTRDPLKGSSPAPLDMRGATSRLEIVE